MSIYKKMFVAVALLTVPGVSLVSSLYATCCDHESFKRRGVIACPTRGCPWERGDGRCNKNQDCCPGRQCSAQNFCEACPASSNR
jgi:hypothetical protein